MLKTILRSGLSLFALLILISNQALALPSYTVIDLGQGAATDINDSGQVVGGVSPDPYGPNMGFYWDNISGRENIDIGGNMFESINNNGEAVQLNYNNPPTGNLWNSITGEVKEIPIRPKAINDLGLVTGYIDGGGGDLAVVWDETNGTQTIVMGKGNDINDDGRVAGTASTADGSRAFIWDNTSGLSLLPTLGVNMSEANAINDFNQVVGASRTTEGSNHAFLWDETSGITDLGTLDYADSSRAYNINNFGQVVGLSYLANSGGVAHATLWDSTNGMMDLHNLIPEDLDWGLEIATSINDLGQIVAYGFDYVENKQRSILLNPAVRNGIVTTDQAFLSDYITLNDTFSFDFKWEMGIDPTEFNFDVLFFNGTGWETFGWLLNFDDSLDEWLTASFSVPEWAQGESTQIMFNLLDFGQETDPTVYLRNINSSQTSSAPVPEPSTILLLSSGLLGLGWYGRKRKKA